MAREREISLRDLFWYLVSKWKTLLVIMFLGGIILGAFGYLKGTEKTAEIVAEKEITEPVEEKNDEAKEETIEHSEPVVGLTDTDIASLNVYFSYKSLYDMQLDYNNTAEVMQLDPYNSYCGYFAFLITPEDQDMLHSRRKSQKVSDCIQESLH